MRLGVGGWNILIAGLVSRRKNGVNWLKVVGFLVVNSIATGKSLSIVTIWRYSRRLGEWD